MAATEDDPAYLDALKQYSKEMLAAKYAEKWCSDFGVTYNREFFTHAPPNLYDGNLYNSFIEKQMIAMRETMDSKRSELGR